jgi:hypothetical protein
MSTVIPENSASWLKDIKDSTKMEKETNGAVKSSSTPRCVRGIQIPPYIEYFAEHLPTEAMYNNEPAKSCLRCGAWLEKENA